MLWIKALHVIGIVAWLAGVFYLPRIFVHYQEGRAAGEDVRRLLVMAPRLYGFMSIMAGFALLFGLWLWLGYQDSGNWLHLKLVFVAGLLIYHACCRALLARMLDSRAMPSSRQLRWFNEAALLLVVPIIVLAVVKPF